ncbi:peptidoglycan editing factor PgeF [Steroidobacter sp. S1-65]|uniref:Purine nucleoside phosphorylase n=1 Tax=Steroidobacter gossypii TaxID=2805490 RepID=A0ABS1WR39_9GAMM|nr:peptidoglycan editing factor PgeF [Steroidobacter gossypii]MBM0103439.1 peptidoglycan editing factor PgeF [Steroidobacter gossypii]
MIEWITPDWPAPLQVKAAATLRTGGVSEGPFASLNLGSHVGDDPGAVAENRRLLRIALALPAEPVWLNQVHGIDVIDLGSYRRRVDNVTFAAGSENAEAKPADAPTADASVALEPGAVCVVMTADCLPVLFCDTRGTRVGAAHAGWRGLAGGVLGATIKALDVPSTQLMAWLGPAIEQQAFEVGDEVRERFVQLDARNAAAFHSNARGRWQADLYRLARNELARLGVTAVYGGGFQCFADSKRYFSYRRDSRTGRMATLVWLAD